MKRKVYMSAPLLLGMIVLMALMLCIWGIVSLVFINIKVLVSTSFVWVFICFRLLEAIKVTFETFFTVTVLSEDTIMQKNIFGKKFIEINLNAVKEIGISSEQEAVEIPICIYFSQKELDSNMKRNLLYEGSDGSIQFMDFDQRIIDYLIKVGKFKNKRS